MIRIGTSGFSYSDWLGAFYPRGLPKSRWFEYYTEEFDCLEVNASFYSWLPSETLASLVRRAPPGFEFAIKLHRSLTHDDADIGPGVAATLSQNEPLLSAGVLVAHLAQFPFSFRPTDDNSARVIGLASHLAPLVVEFRHADWQGHRLESEVRAAGAVVCAVDGPFLAGLPRFRRPSGGELAYVRFHGRNAAKWFQHDQPWERYDYLYSEAQVAHLAEEIRSASPGARKVVAFFNNHYGAQAVANARQLAQALGVGRPPSQRGLF